MMRKIFALAGLLAAGLVLAGPANAGDSNGNIQAKIGVTGVLPDNNTTNSVPAGIQGEVNDEVIPSLTLTYYLNKNLAVELFCCFAKIDVDVNNLGLGKVADAWIFPPVLTLQYHFDNIGPVRPFVGVGVEWIHYFDENAVGAFAGQTVNFDDSVGFALQGGFDYDLGQGWSFGLDVKKVWENTTLTYSGGVVVEHDVDPLFVTANIGYRFNLSDLLGARPAPMK